MMVWQEQTHQEPLQCHGPRGDQRETWDHGFGRVQDHYRTPCCGGSRGHVESLLLSGIRIYTLFIALCTSPGLPQASLGSLGLLINGESNSSVLVSAQRVMSEGLRPCLLMTRRRRFPLDHFGSSTGTDN